MNDTWFPAILLPPSSMCSFHKEFFDSCPPDIKETREQYVGKKIFVQEMGFEVLYPYGYEVVPSKGCRPLRIRGENGTAGCFSCEVAMD